jgi:hypothetical protein
MWMATTSSPGLGASRQHPFSSLHGRQRELRLATATRAQPDQQPDLVTRLFGSLFKGALEDPEPFGLRRLADNAPELYPSPVDKWAAPLAGDDGAAALLRPLLADTQLESAALRLAFDAERDGWSSEAFHERVDGFGAAVSEPACSFRCRKALHRRPVDSSPPAPSEPPALPGRC